jgi:hypothetical protein
VYYIYKRGKANDICRNKVGPMELFHVCANVIFIGGAHHHPKSCFLLALVMLAIAFLALFICQRAKKRREEIAECARRQFSPPERTHSTKYLPSH